MTSFAASWLAGDSSARALLPAGALDPIGRAALAKQAVARPLQPAALTAIRALQAQLPPRPLRDANVEALASGQAVRIVTGQQLGLFLGPLFTLYKAATAVAAAAQLRDRTRRLRDRSY